MTQEINIKSISGPYVTVVREQEVTETEDGMQVITTTNETTLKQDEEYTCHIWDNKQVLISEQAE